MFSLKQSFVNNLKKPVRNKKELQLRKLNKKRDGKLEIICQETDLHFLMGKAKKCLSKQKVQLKMYSQSSAGPIENQYFSRAISI